MCENIIMCNLISTVPSRLKLAHLQMCGRRNIIVFFFSLQFKEHTSNEFDTGKVYEKESGEISSESSVDYAPDKSAELGHPNQPRSCVRAVPHPGKYILYHKQRRNSDENITPSKKKFEF
jgi:hypothetical protein